MTAMPGVDSANRRRLTQKTFDPSYLGQRLSTHQVAPPETKVHPGDELMAYMEGEVGMAIAEVAHMQSLNKVNLSTNDTSMGCPLCPWRRISRRPGRLERHLRHSHCLKNKYVASGRKQLRVAMSIFSKDKNVGRALGGYLHRSASLLRGSVIPPISSKHVSIDKELRLLLTEHGPMFVQKGTLVRDHRARRVGNMHFTRGFAELFLRTLLLQSGRLQATMNSLQLEFQLAGNELGHIMPEHGKTMWGIVEDVLRCPSVSHWRSALLANARGRHDLSVLSCDGTAKICMGVVGQPRVVCNVQASAQTSAWPRSEASYHAFTVRGASGYLVGVPLIPMEDPVSIQKALTSVVAEGDRHLVKWLIFDQCSGALFLRLREAFPELRGLCTDTTHLAMKYEGARGHRSSPGSRLLRQALRKFNMAAAAPTCPWSGSSASTPATPLALRLKENVRHSSLPEEECHLAVADIRSLGPWSKHEEWCRALAAISTLYASEMASRTLRKGKPVRVILAAACDVDRFMWYFNNAIMRADLPHVD